MRQKSKLTTNVATWLKHYNFQYSESYDAKSQFCSQKASSSDKARFYTVQSQRPGIPQP